MLELVKAGNLCDFVTRGRRLIITVLYGVISVSHEE